MGRRRTSLVHTAAEEETASTFSRPSVVVCVFNQNRRRGQTRAEDVEEVNDDSKCAFRLRVKALYICLAADCWHNFREMEVLLMILLSGQQPLKISWNRMWSRNAKTTLTRIQPQCEPSFFGEIWFQKSICRREDILKKTRVKTAFCLVFFFSIYVF